MGNLTSNDLLKALNQYDAAMVYFFSNHCAPCLSLRPKVEEMIRSEFPKMQLIFVDAETEPQTSAKYQVFSSPTILLFFDGRETKRFSKYISMAELEQTIQRYYNIFFEN